MIDFEAARRHMIDSQIRTNNVTDARVLRATGTLEIDTEGRLLAFRSERWAMVGKGFELRPWTAPTYAYGEFEGLRLPVRGAAVWTLRDGSELPYIEVVDLRIEARDGLGQHRRFGRQFGFRRRREGRFHSLPAFEQYVVPAGQHGRRIGRSVRDDRRQANCRRF